MPGMDCCRGSRADGEHVLRLVVGRRKRKAFERERELCKVDQRLRRWASTDWSGYLQSSASSEIFRLLPADRRMSTPFENDPCLEVQKAEERSLAVRARFEDPSNMSTVLRVPNGAFDDRDGSKPMTLTILGCGTYCLHVARM